MYLSGLWGGGAAVSTPGNVRLLTARGSGGGGYNNTSYTTRFKFTAPLKGTYRIKVQWRVSNGGATAYMRAYANGGAISSAISTNSTTSVIGSVDTTTSVDAGTTIEVQFYISTSTYNYSFEMLCLCTAATAKTLFGPGVLIDTSYDLYNYMETL